ncbi:MAG: acylneuraminate cytidylyltransferase family protein, partial [Candidatus Margulisbacteria bacterium]|nr:acylneuraminate cytidylyltransferase family protein [Candidatus Margulisiibacteriota bacterium]
MANKKPMILGIIPARGGSKGIPGKNTRLFGGLPLLAHTINEAKKSKYLSQVILSTDSPEIAEVGRQFGAAVPFLRPAELATDVISVVPALQYCLNRIEQDKKLHADYVVMLQPTTPLRRVKDIDGAIKLLLDTMADSVISVSPVMQHPYYMYYLNGKNKVKPLPEANKAIGKRRQDFPEVYIRNGAVYAAKKEFLEKTRCIYDENSVAYVMPAERGINIDEEMDWELAEHFLRK